MLYLTSEKAGLHCRTVGLLPHHNMVEPAKMEI
jgi:hypothetical protein